MSQTKYQVWLSMQTAVSVSTKLALLEHYGSAENVYSADVNEYKTVEGVRASDIGKMADKTLDAAERALEICKKISCNIITLDDELYPDRLKNIYEPPLLLYVLGQLPIIDDLPVIAVVGTRNCTSYGRKAAEKIGYHLAKRGLTVTTGLAKGIDSAAARGALRGDGPVIGVIGSGVDIVYPKENKELFQNVIESGAIVSEYAPGSPALSFHFPARNRILSGLSLGVTVIEAPIRSGALITASRALEQGRDVFVLPGNTDSRTSEGSNKLLREGAIPILSGEDIVSEYADQFVDTLFQIDNVDINASGVKMDTRNKKDAGNKKEIDNSAFVDYIDFDEVIKELDGDEKVIAKILIGKELYSDDIIIITGLMAQQVASALTMLEIKGIAACTSGLWRLTGL